MHLRIDIDLDNAAFEDSSAEVVRILRQCIYEYQQEGKDLSKRKIRDINGNTVGSMSIDED